MPRYFALEWDSSELRAVVARTKGNELALEQTWSIALTPRAGQAVGTLLVEKITELVREAKAGKTETLLAVGRANLELRILTVPSAPEEETPELVRFQAMRQFSSLGEDWAVDYVPLNERQEEGQTVLAAALSPDLIQQLAGPCQSAGLNVRRIALRPFAAAALVRERFTDDNCRLLVDLLTDEADLTVIAAGQVLLPRTVRVPADDATFKILAGEIRRTMVAATNQLGGRRVAEIVLFGDPRTMAGQAAALSTEVGLPVLLIDPFEGIQREGAMSLLEQDRPGCFAPLLGLLVAEAANRRPEIDFLNPRRRPAPPDNRRLYSLAALTAIAVLLLPVMFIFWQLASLDSEIEAKLSEQKRLDSEDKSLLDEQKAVAQLMEFEKGNVAWLDEIAWLSEQVPKADKVIASELIATMVPNLGGRLAIQATADSTETVAEMETELRDKRHTVIGSGADHDAKLQGLQYRFRKTITIDNEETPVAAVNDKSAPKPDKGGAK